MVWPVIIDEITDEITLTNTCPADLLQERDSVQLRVVNYKCVELNLQEIVMGMDIGIPPHVDKDGLRRLETRKSSTGAI